MVKVPKGYRSRNVQDRRTGGGGGRSGGGFGFPGSGGGNLGGSMGGGLGSGAGSTRMPTSRRGCGGGGLILMLVVLALLFVMCRGAADFGGGSLGGAAPSATPSADSPEVTDSEDLVNFVLDDVQDYWTEYFAQSGETYRPAQLVLFDNAVRTGGCGSAQSAVGPFYCPADGNAYIDLQYMLLLQDRLGAEGDFAQAYILAHEIGHHVQNLVGTNEAVRNAQQGASRAEANALSVKMELQADCLAGMWARRAQQEGILDVGDIEEGVRAAGAVGDDAITGSDNAEQFTHGSSAQRVRWLKRGLDSGDYNQCNAFDVSFDQL